MPTTSVPARPPSTVLVDTSLLIEQEKGDRYAVPVNIALAKFPFKGASSYSKLEFKRAWLQRFAYLHEVSKRRDIASIVDIFHHMTCTLAGHPYQLRRLQTCLTMLVNFLDLNNGQISSRAQLARLRAHCRRCALDGTAALTLLVTHFFTGTRCTRAEEPVKQLPDGTLDASIPRCKAKETNCRIHEFFLEQQSLFIKIADYIDTLPSASPELERMRESIRAALKSAEILCSSPACSRIADAIIAVDGIKMEVYAANNDAEWQCLSTSLGKPLLNPVKQPLQAP
jgi:hypothetical protein